MENESKDEMFTSPGQCPSGCEAALVFDDVTLYVCDVLLSTVSEYFKAMFTGDFLEKKQRKCNITDEHPDDIRNYLLVVCNIVRGKEVNNINRHNLATLMRLSDKYDTAMLKKHLHLTSFIASEVASKTQEELLDWLDWCNQYHMPDAAAKVCLPAIALLPLTKLQEKQETIGLKWYSRLLEMKLSVAYTQGVEAVFNRSHFAVPAEGLGRLEDQIGHELRRWGNENRPPRSIAMAHCDQGTVNVHHNRDFNCECRNAQKISYTCPECKERVSLSPEEANECDCFKQLYEDMCK